MPLSRSSHAYTWCKKGVPRELGKGKGDMLSSRNRPGFCHVPVFSSAGAIVLFVLNVPAIGVESVDPFLPKNSKPVLCRAVPTPQQQSGALFRTLFIFGKHTWKIVLETPPYTKNEIRYMNVVWVWLIRDRRS